MAWSAAIHDLVQLLFYGSRDACSSLQRKKIARRRCRCSG